jgi:predicted nucleic acid-binding protein
LPDWLEVGESNSSESVEDSLLASIDIGERAAIQLAVAVQADLVLMDDRKGVNVAERKGLRVTGTLGVLDLAAERGMVDFAEAVRKLEETSFRRPDQLLRMLLAKHQR